MIFLTEPSIQYKDSFLLGLRDFQTEGRLLNYDLRRTQDDFAGFLYRLQNQQDRTKIPPDAVPTTTFWLIDNTEFIGILSIRHELNDFLLRIAGHIGYQIRPSKRRQGYGKELLRLGLEKAREIGITRALVTCDEDNIGSKKIIEYNHGQFENALSITNAPARKLRYWIDLH